MGAAYFARFGYVHSIDDALPHQSRLRLRMSVLTTLPPAVDDDVVARILRDEYGLVGSLIPLNSERDQNFRLVDGNGEKWVVKIANAAEELETLQLQEALLTHMAASDASVDVPRLRPTMRGTHLASCNAPDGTQHWMRVVRWLDGDTLAARGCSPAHLQALGNTLGRLTVALRGFAHRGAIRIFDWDLAHTSHARDRLAHVDDPERRDLLTFFLDRFDRVVAPALRVARSQVIHGDANDHNVLVREADGVCHVALIDFGDSVFSAIVNEVAVACAYAMLGSARPIEDATYVVRAFHAVHPLLPNEVDLLYDLIAARLVISVTMSASRRDRSGDNAYLSVSEAPAWDLLTRLRLMDRDIVTGILRHACDMEAAPGARATIGWIAANTKALAPVLDTPIPRLTKALVPFGDSASPIAVASASRRPQDAERLWNEWATANGVALGIGPYGEERPVYTAEGFASKLARGDRRSVHLGLDLFRPAGTVVRTPLDGVVVDVYETPLPLDYGHAVLLEHTPAPNVRFWTLWGHLAADTPRARHVGEHLERGDAIASLGTPEDNGGWQPHLHVQLVTYRPASAGDVIGVGEPNLRDVWSELFPDPSTFAALPPETLAHSGRATNDIVQARRQSLLRNLSISYQHPLKIVRGEGAYLFDDTGRAFLDCYNNVAHVGHAHPEVVEVLARQASLLNTNTRYLHDAIVDYAAALTATLPSSLTVAAFVCSGSEANDLALRMARHARGARGVIALDGAYHGHSADLIDVSPYKYKRKGGNGRPATTGEATLPDSYRAPAAWAPNEIAARYAATVSRAAEQIRSAGHVPAAFIAESLPSTAGQIVLPNGYLPLAYQAARDAGALVIADEVQVGFGRFGTHMWGFEAEGGLPDFVTMGKPIGNGHPLATLVTTAEIADRFDNGMEYFNTFGGNPVSCVVGLKVLEILKRDGLMDNARIVGAQIQDGLRALMSRFDFIGDVRGRGLMLGMELVEDRDTKVPATSRAKRVAERCRELGVLLGTDGPWDNVIKIRPPMVFSGRDAVFLLQVLEQALGESRE